MEAGDAAGAGCPWFHRYSAAAYAPSAVATLLAGADAFAAPALCRMYARRAGFAFRIADAVVPSRLDERDARLLSALLAKLAQRGVPAPCSLSLERHVLAKAARAGVTDFDERSDGGQFVFRCRPRISNLAGMLRACLWPELILDPTDAALVADNYRQICAGAQREFFDRLVARLRDERLGLFAIPNRRVLSMLQYSRTRPASFDESVDLAVEIVTPDADRLVRLALDLGRSDESDAARARRLARAVALQAEGWTVLGADDPGTLEAEQGLERIARAIRSAVPAAFVRAADDLRALADEQRSAIEDLVLLPVAEAQLTAFIAESIFRSHSADLMLANPAHLDLGPVVDSVNDAIEAFRSIHRLPDPGRLRLAFTGEAIDAAYYGMPSIDVWSALAQDITSTVAPTVTAAGYVPPLSGAGPRPVRPQAERDGTERDDGLRYLLQNVFRKVEFRPGQVDIIERTLALRPVVGLLPTAAGKSLCYQLATFAQPGFTLIVAPLAALMQDQQDNLRAFGIHRTTAIPNAMLMREDDEEQPLRQSEIEAGEHLFVFVAPERLQMPDFRDYIQALTAYVPVTYCVIDEAHCVSEWGHDFRLPYLNVAPLVQRHCQHDGLQPSLIALTGTASRNVIVDILRELDIQDANALVRAKSFDREELEFEVYQVPAVERLTFLAGKLRSVLDEFGWQPGQPGAVPSGLVFTYVTDDAMVGAETIAGDISGRLRLPVPVYTDVPPRDFRGDIPAWEEEKARVQRLFKRNDLPVLVCTAGFGMGIDKPSIRFTVHTTLPRSLEEFYQQAGRAGRDRKRGRCLVLFADEQPRLADTLLDTERTPFEAIVERAAATSKSLGSDAIRNAGFQAGTFLGEKVERRLLRYVVSDVIVPAMARAPADQSLVVDIPYAALPIELLHAGSAGRVSYESRVTALERTLYRLLTVGGITDYLNEFSRRHFLAVVGRPTPQRIREALERYIRRYATEGEERFYVPDGELASYEDAVSGCGKALIRFLYTTIEKQRRRAIGQMLQSARDAVALGPAVFREHLIAYLEESEFTREVAEVTKTADPGAWLAALDSVSGLDNVTKLLGACRRELEEHPGHPGLLMIGGTCRLACFGPGEGEQDLASAFAALGRYLADPAARAALAGRLLISVERLTPSRCDRALAAMLAGDTTRAMARLCYERATTDSAVQHTAIVALAGWLADAMTRGRNTHE
jgi:superfamily II DNA helicase RecQ